MSVLSGSVRSGLAKQDRRTLCGMLDERGRVNDPFDEPPPAADFAEAILGVERARLHHGIRFVLHSATLAEAGLSDHVELRREDGGTGLAALGDGEVDLLFLDAERTEYPSW